MNKASLTGASRYLSIILIAMQGMLLVLLATFLLYNAYLDSWSKYGNNQDTFSIYLENVSEEHADDLQQYLYTEAMDHQLYIVRRDTLQAKDGSFSGYIYGVYGDIENNDVEFSFCNNKIVTNKMILDLLQSQEEHATLGIEQGSEYSIYDIPRFRFGEKYVIKKLSTMISDSKTVQGQYQISGASQNEQSAILTKIADICGVSVQQLQKSMRGGNVDNSSRERILFIFLAAQVLLTFVYFLLIAIKNLDKKGKLVLMGWSGSSICYELYHCFVWYGIIMVPVLIVAGNIISGWKNGMYIFVSHFLSVAFINVVFLVIEIIMASLVQLSVKNIDAIKGKFPKKILYAFGIIGYIIVSIAITGCGIYIDSPIQYMKENAIISKGWEQVDEYKILKQIAVGNDENSFSGAANKLNKDIYNWYCDMENEDGVFLINTSFYDNEVLNEWRKNQIYENIPSGEFWYFTLSPSYINELGLEIDKDVMKKAQQGTRIYLIPSGMDEEQKESICSWLEETSESGIQDGDIDTAFNRNRKIEFVEYDTEKEFFTWNTEADANYCKMPIIYMCTSANMKYFETESLRAVGLDGYIKFDKEETAQKYIDTEYLKKYELVDNDLQFTNVQNYVDGLQKDLLQTITWFGVVFVILALILLGIMLALATVYRIANEQILNVKKFLGYSFSNMYGKLMLGFGVINSIQFIVLLICKSKFGCLAILIIIFIQWIIFWRYMVKREVQSIIQAFKER